MGAGLCNQYVSIVTLIGYHGFSCLDLNFCCDLSDLPLDWWRLLVQFHLVLILDPGIAAAARIGSEEIVEQEIPRLHHSG